MHFSPFFLLFLCHNIRAALSLRFSSTQQEARAYSFRIAQGVLFFRARIVPASFSVGQDLPSIRSVSVSRPCSQPALPPVLICSSGSTYYMFPSFLDTVLYYFTRYVAFLFFFFPILCSKSKQSSISTYCSGYSIFLVRNCILRFYSFYKNIYFYLRLCNIFAISNFSQKSVNLLSNCNLRSFLLEFYC